MNNFEKALKDEIAKYITIQVTHMRYPLCHCRQQKLEEIAVRICKDCGELPGRIAALAEHYKEVRDQYYMPVSNVTLLCSLSVSVKRRSLQ